MSSEQIRIAQRFASDFMYKTNAMFNTNVLKLLLSVVVGINNASGTFPIAYVYITLELATSFKWIAKQLTELAFTDCPNLAIICSNFFKGLGAAVAAKAASDLARTVLTDKVLPRNLNEILEATKVIVSEDIGKP